MKNARELMLGYIEGTAQQSASLFADTGTLELPYLASIGFPPVLKGPEEIGKFLAFLHDTLYPGFAFEAVKIDIDTPSQVFAEYQINHRSGISGKDVRQQFFGHLEAGDGKIKRLREAVDIIVVAEAIFPNGLKDVIFQAGLTAPPTSTSCPSEGKVIPPRTSPSGAPERCRPDPEAVGTNLCRIEGGRHA